MSMHVELPHRVEWRRLLSGDGSSEWDGETFAEAVSVPARVERRTRIRQSSTGDERVDDTRIMVSPDHAVSVGDQLDGERVEGYDEQTDMSGEIVGFICYLEGRT